MRISQTQSLTEIPKVYKSLLQSSLKSFESKVSQTKAKSYLQILKHYSTLFMKGEITAMDKEIISKLN